MSSTDVQQQGSSSGNVNCGSRAPPPTPNQGGNSSAIVNSDAFSAFLERSLGIANLVLPESPTKPAVTKRDLPVVDMFRERDDVVRMMRDSAKEFGAFQVVNHGICWETVERAEEEWKGLFELSVEEKEGFAGAFMADWDQIRPLVMTRMSALPCARNRSGLTKMQRKWRSFSEMSGPMAVSASALQWGVLCGNGESCREIVDILLEGLGNWLDRSSFTAETASYNASLVCITGQKGIPISQSARIKHSHPSILSTQYQSRDSYAFLLNIDRSWVRVVPQRGALMVTLGDILKVWSNGVYKSVIGRPIGGGKGEVEEEEEKEEEEEEEESKCTCTWMALLYSPPAETTISPITELMDSQEKRPNYTSFSLKDYASRLQKQRFMFKDPLDRYKIK